jgi:amino acid adenylation domain-containing protein
MIELIEKLQQQGVSLALENDEIKISFDGDHLDEDLLNSLRENKANLVAYLKKYSKSSAYAAIPVVAEQMCYPLSSAQQRLWILSQLEEAAVAYNLPINIPLKGGYDIPSFRKAIDLIIDRHEVLRTVFRFDSEGEIKQWVLNSEELGFNLDFFDFRNKPNAEQEVTNYVLDDSFKPFDFENGPLLRVALFQLDTEDFVLYFNMHHIISDAWSYQVLTSELFSYYEACKNNTEAQLTPLSIQYKDYAVWQLEQTQKDESHGHLDYWVNALSGELPLFELPTRTLRHKVKTFHGHSLGIYLSEDLTSRLLAFSKKQEGSLFMALIASWKVLFHKYSGATDLIIGSPVAGRDHPQLEDQIGFYLNTIALRNELDPEESFASFFAKVKSSALDAYEHQSYPFDQVVENLDLVRDPSRNAVFDVMLSLQNTGDKVAGIELSNEQIQNTVDHGSDVAKYDLELVCEEVGAHLNINLQYNTDLYDRDMIERLIGHYKVLLHNLVEEPEAKIKDAEYLTNEEFDQVVNGFNQTQLDYPTNKNVVELFHEQALKTPENEAVCFGADRWTYKQLDEISSKLAKQLIADQGVEPQDFIGVQLDRSNWLIASILAIMKAGAVYVPIDPAYPDSRKEYMAQDTQLKLLITDTEYMFDVDFFDGPSFAVDVEFEEDSHTGELPEVALDSSMLAYVIYTSGSTGKPKGVMVQHQPLVNLCTWSEGTYELTDRCKSTMVANISFDASVWELFPYLVTGGCLYPVKNEERINGDFLINLFQTEGMTHVFLPTALYKTVASKLSQLTEPIKAMVGGEALGDEQKNDQITLYNNYGPTEATVIASARQVVGFEGSSSNIGKPIANTQLYILDANLKACAVGVVGEVCISGDLLAKGYLNNPELTNEKFVSHPFIKGGRLYKTGDVGCWLPDGSVEFFGRSDDQVKVRGYRIELGEIETALRGVENVTSCIVVAAETADNEKELVAYFVASATLNDAEIQAVLKRSLPDYMVPMHFVQLNSLPLTPNGKTDKKALPPVEGLGKERVITYVAPTTPTEKTLVEIWEKVLQREKIGIHDDFFELGGHSIKAMKLVSEIQREFDLSIEVSQIFVDPQVAGIATEIDNYLWQQKDLNIEEASDTLVI